MSEAKRNASRKNGSKSKGSTSQRGKNNSKGNALTMGLFSNQSVIPFLGEKLEDFDNLKRKLRGRFQPDDIVVEMLVHEAAVGFSRIKRIERAAGAAVHNHRLQTKDAEREKVRAVNSLKDRFYQVYRQKIASLGPNLQFGNLTIEMAEVRSQLMMSSTGISFLIGLLRSARDEVSRPKNNPYQTFALIAACAGIADQNLNTCVNALALCRTPTEGSQPSPLSDAEIKLDPATIALLEGEIFKIEFSLMLEQDVAQMAEEGAATLQEVTAPLLTAKIANRISRAEADAQRKFYRPLKLLLFKESEGG